MSLDVTLIDVIPVEVYEANITHNLAAMAKEAGIYYHLWRPDEVGIKRAGELISPLELGVQAIRNNPEKYKALNPLLNGWGSYEQFIPWIENYIKACKKNPNAIIEISR